MKGEVEGSTTLEDAKNRLAAIAGTSTCHLIQSPEPVFVKGVWGPYKHAVFPGCKYLFYSVSKLNFFVEED